MHLTKVAQTMKNQPNVVHTLEMHESLHCLFRQEVLSSKLLSANYRIASQYKRTCRLPGPRGYETAEGSVLDDAETELVLNLAHRAPAQRSAFVDRPTDHDDQASVQLEAVQDRGVDGRQSVDRCRVPGQQLCCVAARGFRRTS